MKKRMTLLTLTIFMLFVCGKRVEAICNSAALNVQPFTASVMNMLSVGDSPTNCCEFHIMCGLVAEAAFQSCMATLPFRGEVWCRRIRGNTFIECMNMSGGICEPGCRDSRSGIVLPCSGSGEVCTWGSIGL